MFLKYGIRSITMDDISSKLGISKKTLYQYVNRKEDLIRQVINNEILKRTYEVKVLLKEECNAIEQLIHIQKLIIGYIKKYSNPIEFDLKKYYPGIYNVMNGRYIKLLDKLFVFNIRKGKMEGLYREDLNDLIIAKMHTSRVLNIPQSNNISMEDFTSEEYMHEMIHYHLRALLNNKSMPILDKYIYELK